MNELQQVEEIELFLKDLIKEINDSNRTQTSSRIELSLANLLGVDRYSKIMDNNYKDLVLMNQVKDCLDIKLHKFPEDVKLRMRNILCDVARAVGHERDYITAYTSLVSLMSDGRPFKGRLVYEDVCESILGASE